MSVQSLTNLLKQADINDHEEVLKAANSALKSAKNDVDAQHAKAVALLKLDRYDDAVRVFETGGDGLKDRARLEFAYALYKTGKAEDAAAVVGQHGADRGSMHLEAQARYRTEDFVRAAELYERLWQRREEDAEADLMINFGAVDAQLLWSGRGEEARNEKPDLYAFETAYNSACQAIARGELGQGEVLLRRAKDVCASSEDMTEDEKAAELLPITIQQVYVLSRLGKAEEAERLAETVDAGSIPDASTRHIAQVNSIAASRSPKNTFLAQRIVAKDPASLKPDYPFHFQSSILKQNRYASDLQSLKYDGIAESTSASISKSSSPTLASDINTLSVLNAAAHAKNQNGKDALKIIVPILEKRPNDVGLILTICQLYALTGQTPMAISMLQSFFQRLEQAGSPTDQDVRFAPGLVGAMVALQTSLGRREHAAKELTKAATYWRRKGKDRPTGMADLLKAAGSALLESQDPADAEVAKDLFNHLHEEDKEDKYAAAGLLAASPQQPPASQAAKLTPIDRLIAGIDAEALEMDGIAMPPAMRQASVVARKRPAADSKPKKAKKIRKSRMPKDYDAEKKPDPERWLPMRDRSSYKPKGKKGKARQALLSQGAAAPADSDGSRPGTPAGQVVQGKSSGGQNKKKKGKGKAR